MSRPQLLAERGGEVQLVLLSRQRHEHAQSRNPARERLDPVIDKVLCVEEES